MNNIYEKKLDDILKKYNMNKQITDDSTLIHNILMSLFVEKCKGKVSALWGAGRNNSENSHASVILTDYATYVQKIKCLIDSSNDLWGKTFLDYPIISPNEIESNHIELIIIASKNSADSIKKSISKYAPKCEVLDIYDELRKRGIEVYQKFFQESGIYTKIFLAKDKYINETNALEKEKSLKELIMLYLHIFDFYYAKKFSAEYITRQYTNYKELQSMWEEINNLLLEVKEKNSVRRDDIVIHFIDSLREIDVFEKNNTTVSAKLLKSYAQNAAIFSNAYATGPTTYESVLGIIGKQHSFEKNVYENNFIFDFDEFDLLKFAEKENMEINIFNSPGYKIIKETDRANFKSQIYMTEKLWTIATTIAQSKKSTLNFVYYPCELHFPLLCGYHKNKPETGKFSDVGIKDMSGYIENQFNECLNYVDIEFEFYKKLYGNNITHIFFSDHSQVVYDSEKQEPYYTYYKDPDRSVHVTFFACGNKIKPNTYGQLCSMIDFNDIIKQLLISGEVELPDRQIVRYQYYDIHNNELRETARERGFLDYIDGIICYMSDKYLYAFTATGKEELFIKKENKWIKEDDCYRYEFVKYIKENKDLSFPLFFNHHK